MSFSAVVSKLFTDREDVSFHPSLCWSPFIHYSNVPLAVLDSLRSPSLWRESHKKCNGFQILVIYNSLIILANINLINLCYSGKSRYFNDRTMMTTKIYYIFFLFLVTNWGKLWGSFNQYNTTVTAFLHYSFHPLPVRLQCRVPLSFQN